MFTADDYFNITNAHILNENVNHLDERKVEPDEKLPSGKTPNEKMERAQRKHGARYMLSGGGRNNPARDSHFSRGSKVKKIADIIKSGEDPRNSPQAGVGWGNDARKTGRPGVSTADRTSRTQRNDDTDAKSTYTQGGLRAHKTKAGGYRTLERKEEFDAVVEYLFVEGFADTIENAEVMAENISETWVNEILDEAEKVFPLGKVADKMRKVGGEMKSSKSPEEKAKLRKRLDAMGNQYWQPN